MSYKTKITNKSGQAIWRISGLANIRQQFDITDGASIVISSRDEYGLFARYSEIIFQKGESITKKSAESNIITELIYPGPVKCIIRKDWIEPKRPFPVVSFLNLGAVFMETIYPDCFNSAEKLMLPLGIPILFSVPCYSPIAKFREYIIHPEEFDEFAGDFRPYHEMKHKRPQQELDRLARMLNDWRESEKNRIKVM